MCVLLFFQAEDGILYAHCLLEFRRVLCRSKIEAGIFHDQFACRSSDQDILMFMIRKMYVEAIDASYHSKGSKSFSAACAIRSSGSCRVLRYRDIRSAVPSSLRSCGS